MPTTHILHLHRIPYFSMYRTPLIRNLFEFFNPTADSLARSPKDHIDAELAREESVSLRETPINIHNY